MCFRPAEAELGPIKCPNCEKKINRIAGQVPEKCPFCKGSTEGYTDWVKPAAAGAPGAPGAPAAPAAPGAPAAPKAPGAPGAPAAPATPKAPGA